MGIGSANGEVLEANFSGDAQFRGEWLFFVCVVKQEAQPAGGRVAVFNQRGAEANYCEGGVFAEFFLETGDACCWKPGGGGGGG